MVSSLRSVEQVPSDSWQASSGRPLTEGNFRRLMDFVYGYCGIRLTTQKRTMVDSRLRRRMRLVGIEDINQYCELLFDADSNFAGDETEHFINAITTNKTDFFREIKHFWFLRDKVFPAYAEAGKHQIAFWSAACSTGAEPYTMAMLLEEYRLAHPGCSYSVIASDICTDVLNRAVAGCYPMVMLEGVPPPYRERYVMMPRLASRGEFRIKPDLRTKVAFLRLNLMDHVYPVQRDFDVVFCRNTLIYFDRNTQFQVVSRLCSHLGRGGYLFLGHSESITGFDLPLVSVGSSVFQRL